MIRCTGRKVRRGSLTPYGRECGTEFTSTAPYRSPGEWIELARTSGWRISPLSPDNTVIACCPTCNGVRPR